MLAVRFAPRLDRHNLAPANRLFAIPVTVDRQAVTGPVRDLAVRVSFDDGRTWRAAPVLAGHLLVGHPEGHGFVSLRATAADRDGNAFEETLIRAYRF